MISQTTCLKSCRPPLYCQSSMACGIWHRDISSRSFKSCKLGHPWIGFVGPAHPLDALSDWDLGNLKAKATLWNLCHVLKPFLNNFCSVAGSIIHEGVYVVCNHLYVGGTCPSNIHMNAKTQGSLRNTVQSTTSFGLPFSHSTSCSHLFFR